MMRKVRLAVAALLLAFANFVVAQTPSGGYGPAVSGSTGPNGAYQQAPSTLLGITGLTFSVTESTIKASWTSSTLTTSNITCGGNNGKDNALAPASTSHQAIVTNLSPSTQYSCTVTSGSFTSNPQLVTTSPLQVRKLITNGSSGTVSVIGPPGGGDTMTTFVSSDNVSYMTQSDGFGINGSNNAGANFQLDSVTDEVNFASGSTINLFTNYGAFATNSGTDGPAGTALTNKANGIFGLNGHLFMFPSRNRNGDSVNGPTAPAFYGNIIRDNGDHGATWNNFTATSTFNVNGNFPGTGGAGTMLANNNYGWISPLRYGADDGTLGYFSTGNQQDGADAYVYCYFMSTGQVTNDLYLLRILRLQFDAQNASAVQYWIGPASPTPADFVNDSNWSASDASKVSVLHTTFTIGWAVTTFIPTLNSYYMATLIQTPPYGPTPFKDWYSLSAPTPAGPWTSVFMQGSRSNQYSALIPFHRDALTNVASDNIALRVIGTKGNGYRVMKDTFTAKTSGMVPYAFQAFSQTANQNPITGSWTVLSSTVWSTAPQVLSNQFETTATSKNAGAITTTSVSQDQCGEITIGSNVAVTASPGIIVRGVASGDSYLASINSGSTTSQVFKITGGGASSAQLGSNFNTSGLAQDDVVRFCATGSSTTTLTVSRNGTQVFTVNDSSTPLTAGVPGVRDFQSTGPTGDIQFWAAYGTQPTFSISGNAASIAGATITYSGTQSGSVVADGSGNYTIPGLINGAYLLVPSGSGHTFNPVSKEAVVTGANVTGVNFL